MMLLSLINFRNRSPPHKLMIPPRILSVDERIKFFGAVYSNEFLYSLLAIRIQRIFVEFFGLATKFFEKSSQKMLRQSYRRRLSGSRAWVNKPTVVEAGAGPKIWARTAA